MVGPEATPLPGAPPSRSRLKPDHRPVAAAPMSNGACEPPKKIERENNFE